MLISQMTWHAERTTPTILSSIMILAALLSCTSAKNANGPNFEAAIRSDETRRNERLCVRVNLGRDFQDGGESVPPIREPERAALVSAGLATRAVVSREGPFTGGYYRYNYDYSMTDYGKQFGQPVGTGADFCYATLGLERVTNFTEPTDSGVAKVSQVRYTYKLQDLATWARDAAIQRAFPEVASYVAGEHRDEKSTTLWLTDKGWEVVPQRQ